MDVEKYFRERLSGKSFDQREYNQDNREFYNGNNGLATNIAYGLMERETREYRRLIAIGGGQMLYEREFIASYSPKIENWDNYDKRQNRGVTVGSLWLLGREAKDPIWFMSNVIHTMKNPTAYLEALPVGSTVVIIDTFISPNSNVEWIYFFDRYMREINKSNLPHMAYFDSLPGWKVILEYQNVDKMELGYLVLRKVI